MFSRLSILAFMALSTAINANETTLDNPQNLESQPRFQDSRIMRERVQFNNTADLTIGPSRPTTVEVQDSQPVTPTVKVITPKTTDPVPAIKPYVMPPRVRSTPARTIRREPVVSRDTSPAVRLSQEWMRTPERPAMGQKGVITFMHGESLPVIFCAPLRSCDIQLQAGEKVRDLHVGDTVRWKISPAISGPDDNKTTHLILKPTMPDLDTNVVVTTDRRTYHMRIRSSASNWMPAVAFTYQEDVQREWAMYQAQQRQETKEREKQVVPETGGRLASQLDFEYEIRGRAPWRPLRVYNDGQKTYLQMPESMEQSEAPALLVIGPTNEEQLINYRLRGDRYIVDQVFNRAVLIAGVGRKQLQVTITRDGHRVPMTQKRGPSNKGNAL